MSSSLKAHPAHPLAASAEADTGTGLNNRRCRDFYLQKGENKCYLFAIVFGATRDDLVDVCMSVPFTSASNSTKRLFEPNGSVLKDEIGRRVHSLVGKMNIISEVYSTGGSYLIPRTGQNPSVMNDLKILVMQLPPMMTSPSNWKFSRVSSKKLQRKRQLGRIFLNGTSASLVVFTHAPASSIVLLMMRSSHCFLRGGWPCLINRWMPLVHCQKVRIFGLPLRNSSTKAHFNQSLTSCLFMTLGISSLHCRC